MYILNLVFKHKTCISIKSPGMISYTLDYTTGAWSQDVRFTRLRHLFTHIGFPECPCCLEFDINYQLVICLWTNYFRLTMTDGNFLPYTFVMQT